jgi:gamma-glutamylcyclotransferase (GGCT)/AIG2-like uncharacterized protein YtfP
MPLLFSYGTLQREDVQLRTFGRLLEGRRSELLGFELSPVETPYPNVVFNGRHPSRVGGMVFQVTDSELAAADAYERSDAYERVSAKVASGEEVWVYLDARHGAP